MRFIFVEYNPKTERINGTGYNKGDNAAQSIEVNRSSSFWLSSNCFTGDERQGRRKLLAALDSPYAAYCGGINPLTVLGIRIRHGLIQWLANNAY